MFEKLQRPPPETRIFCPALSACSRTMTERPLFPASIAHINPAAPAPITIISFFIKPLQRNPSNLKTAVGRAVFRSGSSLSAVLSSFCYSRETHPPGSDSHCCLTLHFAKNSNERRAKSLKPALPTAEYRINKIYHVFFREYKLSACKRLNSFIP